MPAENLRRVEDLEALRAFVHPLRLRLLRLLRVDGPATGSDLARRLGESSGSTSYHLRQLARFGFVEDENTQGSKRERVWRAADVGLTVPGSAFVGDRERWDVVRRLAHQQIETWLRGAEVYLADPNAWGADWADAATIDDMRLRLSPDQARAMNTEVEAVVARYRAEYAERSEGEIVSVFYGAVPVRTEDL